MAVKHEWGIGHNPPSKVSTRKAGQQPMIATPSYRQVSSKRLKGGQRSFQNAVSLAQTNPRWYDRPARNSITWQTGRYDAGIILKASIRKHFEGPQRILDDREIGRAISLHRHSDDLFEKIF